MMTNFKSSPHCKLAVTVSVEPHEMLGDRVSSWLVSSPGGQTYTVSTETLFREFKSSYVDESGNGIYSHYNGEPIRYEINYADETVLLENDTSMPLDEFARSAVRCDPSGTVISTFIEPFYKQYERCTENGNAFLHLYDLQQLTEHFRSEKAQDTGLYDIVSSGLSDDRSFMDRMAAISAPSWNTEALHSLEKADLPMWMELHTHPMYAQSQFREMFKNLMSDYIQDFPMERVKACSLMQPLTDITNVLNANATLISVNAPFTMPNIMRGYSTSEVYNYQLDDIRIIAFSDMTGSYAYAWPSHRMMNLDIDNTAPAL